MIRFAYPQFFFLIPLVPLFWWIQKFKRSPSIRFTRLDVFQRAGRGWRPHVLGSGPLLRIVTLCLVIAALARPQTFTEEQEITTRGVDIVLAIDISGSMMAEDFKPKNRFTVAIDEARKFINGRKHDRIGLVVFSSQSYTQCPLTIDYHVLLKLLGEIRADLVKDGTAIGLAIANAINRLRESSAESKVIVLLTDGENNAGNIDPITAAELAKGFGIKIYTIGAGKEGLVPFPVDDPLFGKRYVQAKVDIDEETLQKIATITGGKFFRAYDEEMLGNIYQQIDRLEKSEIHMKRYSTTHELFPIFLYPALALLLMEIFLSQTFLLKVP